MKMLWPALGWRLFLLLSQAHLGGAEGASPITFTNALEIVRLSREEAARAHPVKLTGVVTYSDPQWRLLFIHDASAGVFVALAGGAYPTNTEQVEIVGRTGEGSFLPVVAEASWRRLGTANLPGARRVSQPELYASEIDCEWSELIGVVRRITLIDAQNHYQIDLRNGGWRAQVFLPTPGGRDLALLSQLIDARVSILGVGGVEYDSIRGVTGLKAFVPHRNCIRVLDQPIADPFLLPTLPLATVRGFSGTNIPIHRIHIRGIATCLHPPSELVLQEENSALRVLVSGVNQFKVGDGLEAVGFLAPGGFSPVLEEALIRPATAKLQAKPISVAPATVLWGDYDARLVQVSGLVQNHVFTETNHILTLLQDGILFGVSLPASKVTGEWTQFKKGDRVRVTGICVIQGDQRQAPQSFQVLLRTASDAIRLPGLHVYSVRQVLTISLIAAAACGLVLIWGITLKRQVREQTAVIRARLEKEVILEKRYHYLLENAAFPVIIFHRDTLALLYLNQRAGVRLFGAATVPLHGLASEVCDNQETLQIMLRELQNLGQLTEFEFCFRTIEGQRFWALISANTIEFDHQPAVILSFSDISERKHAEQQLKQSYSLLQATLESTADGILVVDSSGKIVGFNTRFVQLWHIPEDVLVPKDDERALRFVLDQLNDPAAFLAQVRQLYAQPDAESFDVLEFKDGRVFERYSRSQRIEDRPVGRVWSFRDVTGRKRLEDQLRQAHKLEGIGHLAGGLAHEFNNILAAITLNLALIRAQPLDAEGKEFLETVETLSKRAADLVRQLLAFSRQSVIHTKPLDLSEELGNFLPMLRRLVGEHIVLEFAGATNLPKVLADQGMINQVLLNLCLNARDAMAPGGHLKIELQAVELDAQRVNTHPEAVAGRFVCLLVSDTGRGMDEVTRKRLFEPFFTTKEVGKGTGLGLATVYGIVKQHHGWIEVESAIGYGTTFRIFFPTCDQSARSE